MHSQIHYPITAGDLNIYHARLIADQQVTYILEFNDHLDLERVQAGVEIIHTAFPLLSCVVKHRGSQFRWVNLAGYRPSISVLDTLGNIQDEIAQFISTPCDPESQPPLKVRVIRDQRNDYLCFKIDHVVSDAAGLKFLLYLFAEAYSSEKIATPINQNRGLWQILRSFTLPTLLNAARKADVPHPGPALINGQFDPKPIFIAQTSLDPEQFDKIHKFAKKCGATINDLLLAAAYEVAFERLQPDEGICYPIMIPVDMRRHLPEKKQGVLGNLSSAVYPSLSRKPDEDFQEILKRVKSAMDAFKRDIPGLGAVILMTIGAMWGGRMLRDRYQLAAARGSRFINLTNFGVIDEVKCCFGNLKPVQAYGVGPNQYAPGILLAVSTYQNWLHFVVQGNDIQKFQPFVQQFLDSIAYSLNVSL